MGKVTFRGYRMSWDQIPMPFFAIMGGNLREPAPIDASTGEPIPEQCITRSKTGRVLNVGDDPDVGDEE
jgi:hypothetical protein